MERTAVEPPFRIAVGLTRLLVGAIVEDLPTEAHSIAWPSREDFVQWLRTTVSFPDMGSFGPLEIILIFLVVLLIFGAKRIPEIARGIGKGIREFKDATNEISREIESESQRREINEPRSPKQGTPQARQPQQEPAANADAESGDAPPSEGDAAPSDASESPSKQKET